MDEKEAVETPAEETAETESAPVEEKTADAPKESADTTVEPENKVSDSVPYSRFKEVNDELRRLKEAQPVVDDFVPTQETSDNPFDEATTTGVVTLAEKVAERAYEKKEAQRWVNQHADELKDRAVDALTRDLIRQGFDRDTALSEAQKELGDRVNSTRKEALTEGVKEGQELARSKDQMGAIGTTGSSSKIDPNTLPSDEFAKFHGLQRVE
jgi:hypothetical protein